MIKGKNKITFDIPVRTKKGILCCTRLVPREAEVAGGITDKKQITMNVKMAHDALGHMDEARTREIAKQLDIKITRGRMQPCDNCAAAKAKQKCVPKASDHIPSRVNYLTVNDLFLKGS